MNLEAEDACQSAESATRGEAGTNRRKGQTRRSFADHSSSGANVVIRDRLKNPPVLGIPPNGTVN